MERLIRINTRLISYFVTRAFLLTLSRHQRGESAYIGTLSQYSHIPRRVAL